ncbi:MAG: hypothetical protein KKA07_00720 [Bacteroidetes bacterium]|nr:hypothetical protein [Bacteroidota bacterium]MBU1717573.1 hypothetical protein [Bacteroidota bacterium]
MKTLSLKLDDIIFQETEQVLAKIKKPRNRYINEALQYYNRLQKKRITARLLEKESMLVQADSLFVLAEFENLYEYED